MGPGLDIYLATAANKIYKAAVGHGVKHFPSFLGLSIYDVATQHFL